MFKPCKFIIGIFLVIIVFMMAACSSDNGSNQNNVIASINDFKLTREEFQKALVKEMEYTTAYKTSPEAKKKLLQAMIKKELFIQEAKKRGLDRQKEFTSAIERYWEATLIKHLMEEKNKEIMQTATVSENEIRQRYKKLKSENTKLPPFEDIEKEIAKELFETKKTLILNQWIKSLYDDAKIKINSRLINE